MPWKPIQTRMANKYSKSRKSESVILELAKFLYYSIPKLPEVLPHLVKFSNSNVTKH